MGITAMRMNNLGYLLKEGFKGIFRHGFMSFAAVCVTVACLLIVGSFTCLVYNINIMVEDLNKTNEILVYIDSDLPDSNRTTYIGTDGLDSEDLGICPTDDVLERFATWIEMHYGDIPDQLPTIWHNTIQFRYGRELLVNTFLWRPAVQRVCIPFLHGIS